MVIWDRQSVTFTHMGEYMTSQIKSGMRKLLNTTIQPEAWLVIILCNTQGQEILATITQVGMTWR